MKCGVYVDERGCLVGDAVYVKQGSGQQNARGGGRKKEVIFE